MGIGRENKINKLGREVGSVRESYGCRGPGENPTTGNIRSRNVKNRERKGKEKTKNNLQQLSKQLKHIHLHFKENKKIYVRK